MKSAIERILKGIAFPLVGIGALIISTVIGLVVDKNLAEKSKKEAASVKKIINTPTSIPTVMLLPTNTPLPLSPTPTNSISAMQIGSTASATISPSLKVTSTPTVQPTAPPQTTP